MGLLSAMQTQMETLQRQTQVYRRKLAEQTAFSHTDATLRRSFKVSAIAEGNGSGTLVFQQVQRR